MIIEQKDFWQSSLVYDILKNCTEKKVEPK